MVFSVLPDRVGDKISNSALERGAALEMDGEVIGWLLVTANTRELIPNSAEDIFLRTVNRASLTSALVAALLALTLGGFLALTLTRSLRELREATVEIARGRFGKQVKVRSKDELGELAVSFNQMSLDLERATQARRQMTADIAHDLRSPLSVLSGYAEALSDGKLAGNPEIYDYFAPGDQPPEPPGGRFAPAQPGGCRGAAAAAAIHRPAGAAGAHRSPARGHRRAAWHHHAGGDCA